MSEKKRSCLGRLIRSAIGLAVLIAIGLAFMYSEKVQRYPWNWENNDLDGFWDYCLLKGDEVKTGTKDIFEKIKDSEFKKELAVIYDKYFTQKKETSETSETTEEPTGESSGEAPTEAPEKSEALQKFEKGYDLFREGNKAEGDDADELYKQAVDVWKKEAIPLLQSEIEKATQDGDNTRVQMLEEIYKSLNQRLHGIGKDSKVY